MTIYFPPEWAPQSAVMLTWPHHDTIWADTMAAIDAVFVQVATEIAKRQQVLISCYDDAHYQHVQTLLTHAHANMAHIQLFKAASDDIWVRDHGPLTVMKQQQPCLLDFTFNGWGNKYPAENDNRITHALHVQRAFAAHAYHPIAMVLEGGAVEVDGRGTLLTTKSCLLAMSRNPQLSFIEIENNLKNYLGIKKILWLEHGQLAGDDTDGHIDTLARFTDPHTICYVSCDDINDPHYAGLKQMAAQLRTFTDVDNKPYRLVALPWPKARFADFDGRRLPATYANFLIINDAVLVPTYADPADEQALQILADCFPDRKIIDVPCLAVIQWYGSLHCMTMQLPLGVI